MNESGDNKLSKSSLIGLVIGSMIGGGAFNIMSDMGGKAGGLAIIIGWIITAIGMISLAFVFQNLTNERPELDGGIYSYAQAGFGDFVGFINSIVTVAKLIPILLVIICMIIAFNFDTFKTGFFSMTSEGVLPFSWASTMSQVKSTMLVTVWVFIGIEGAVIFSSRAKNKKDVGSATVIGLISVLIIYFLLTVLAQGVILQNHISQLDSPSMAQVLATIVGGWGSTLVNIGLIISVLGAWLGWTLLAGELPFIVAKDGLFPKWFAKENKNGAPVNALLITNILVQLFLISMLFTQSAYQFAFSLASSAILYPYMFSAFYQVKYTLEHRQQATTKQWTIGIIASIYAIWLIYAAGINYLLLTMLLYIPALLVYSIVQKNNQTRLIKSDYILFMIIIVLAVIGLIKLLMGTINVF
ncbi:TPA: amino acid permease [Staphylococcus aureus]|nr:amino acid permease [Staphylococcus aureus]